MSSEQVNPFARVGVLSVEECIFLCKTFCKQLGVKYRIKSLPWPMGGRAYLRDRKIELSPDYGKEILSICLHELGHLYAKDVGKFPIAHRLGTSRNKREFLAYARTLLRAEGWVDKYAEKLLKDMYPLMLFTKSYNDLDGIQMADQTIENERQRMSRKPAPIRRKHEKRRLRISREARSYT